MDEKDVLLIEDNATDAELILRSFRKLEPALKIQVISDGAEALKTLSELSVRISERAIRGPRVILLDLNMPKVDGLEVLRRIKSDKFIKAAPVVILTSSTNEKDISECYKSGANSYIVKPLGYEDLSETICEIIHYWLELNQPALF